MAKTIVKNSEIKKYQLSEKNRQAILAPNPFPSVWEVIEKQRAAFKAMYGDYWGQQPVKMMGGRS